MKSYIRFTFESFVLTLVIVVQTIDVTGEEQHSTLVGYMHECQIQENATDDDAFTLGQWQVPETREAQCMAACIVEKLGIIQENKFSREGYEEAAKELLGKAAPSMDEEITLIKQECGEMEHTDKCELMMDIIQCFEDIGLITEDGPVPE